MVDKKMMKYQALHSINLLLATPGSPGALDWAFLSNQYATEEEKKAFRKAVDDVRWQLARREDKMQKELFG